MLQTHSMILWARPAVEDFETTVTKVHQLLLALQAFGPEISANYKTVRRKKDARPFVLSKETLIELIKAKAVSSNMDDLGYRISFFSSLNDNDAAGIGLTVGVSSPKFYNTFIINLPQSLPVYSNIEINQRLVATFKQCITIFDPFWGCVSNHVNSNRYNSHFHNDLPVTIHWLNYFGNDIVERIGEEKIKAAPLKTVERHHNGYFLELKDMPIDDEVEADIKLQTTANNYFQL